MLEIFNDKGYLENLKNIEFLNLKNEITGEAGKLEFVPI